MLHNLKIKGKFKFYRFSFLTKQQNTQIKLILSVDTQKNNLCGLYIIKL